MTNKINEKHSLSNILNKQSKKSLEITPLSLKHSREIFAMHINDCFRISNEDAHLLENMGIHAIENYDFLYSKRLIDHPLRSRDSANLEMGEVERLRYGQFSFRKEEL